MGDVLPGDTLHSGRKRLTPVDNGGRIRAYSGVGRAEGDAAVHHCTLVNRSCPRRRWRRPERVKEEPGHLRLRAHLRSCKAGRSWPFPGNQILVKMPAAVA